MTTTAPSQPRHRHSATGYQAQPIPADALVHLQQLDDAGRPMEPYVASEAGSVIDSVGSPLRCCLRPIRSGERVALASYAPLRRWAEATGARPGAYDEVGPVFIHADPCDGPGAVDGYPFVRPGALRAVRRYDARGHIIGGRLVELPEDANAGLDHALAEAFADPAVVLVHVRAVEYGCFHFEVRRPTGDER